MIEINVSDIRSGLAPFPDITKASREDIRLIYPDGRSFTYPVFAQGAMCYDNYNEYLKDHGCACCSLTTVLAALSDSLADLSPDRTIEEIEPAVLPEQIVRENYAKPEKNQSPLTLYGITTILTHYGIHCRYVPRFRRSSAIKKIASHLEKGDPVIVETSRLRYSHGIPVSVKDRKYAGSYHTTVLLCIEKDGDTVWMADSAYRKWSGTAQRIKRVSLRDLSNYMFPNVTRAVPPLYYSGRSTAGGYILISL